MFERFIARQAILKDNLALLGYDLRFRSQDASDGQTSASSAAYLIDSATMVFHWESLTANTLAFIALGAQELLNGAALMLPRARTVIEIPLSVPCSAEIILACRIDLQTLKSGNHSIFSAPSAEVTAP